MKRLLDFVLRRHQPDVDALSAHLDGQLDHGAALTLESHVAACAACRARLDELLRTRALVRSLPAGEPARSFRLSRSVLEAAPPRRSAPQLLRLAPALSAAAALVFAVVIAADIYSSGGRTGERSLNAQSAKAPEMQRAAPAAGATSSGPPDAGAAADSGRQYAATPQSETTGAGAVPAPATPPGDTAAGTNSPAGESPTGTTALSARDQTRSTEDSGAGRLAMRIVEALVAAVAIGAAAVAVGSRMMKRGGQR